MSAFIKQFNKLSRDNGNLLQKAILTSAPNVGEALIPEKVEQIITNLIPRLAPEIAVLKTKSWPSKNYTYRRLTSRPAAGGAMGEAGTTARTRGTYSKQDIEMKIIRRKGSVTNFLQDASREEYDAAAAEMQNHLEVQAHDIIYYTLWGNADANAYEHSGLDSLISSNRTIAPYAGTVPTSLKTLDDMIDINSRYAGANHDKVFVMSPEMASVFSRLLTNVRLNQNAAGGGTPSIEIEGGWRLQTYRNIPIIESGSMKARSKMGTVTPSTATSGGTIADDTYYFHVAPVTPEGEQEACTEINQVTGGGGTSTITLSFTAFTDAISYKVYCSDATQTEVLTRQVPAFTYDADGAITGNVTSIVLTSDPTTADSSVPTGMQGDRPFVASGAIVPEPIILWDLDPFQGMGRYAFTNSAGSAFNGLITMKQLAETDDFLDFLIKTYGCLVPAAEFTSVMYRGLKTA